MTQAGIFEVAPFFIVADLLPALAFYRDRLGFKVVFEGPPEDPFFGIVRRDGAMILMKSLGVGSVDVAPVPNYGREPAHSWDAYFEVPDPDALAAEFASRGVAFAEPLRAKEDRAAGDDGLRGFVVRDPDGHGLYFGHFEG